MSEKRRDNKNRILQTGESQRKDGRYAYKYVDGYGKPQFVYAWKLVPTDKTPAGKRDDISLREKEKRIRKDIDDGIELPTLSPHIFRHTFCTNMANKGMNPKALKYIMGHKNIKITLDYYAHATSASAKEEMGRVMAM